MNDYTDLEQQTIKAMSDASQSDGELLEDGRMYYYGFVRDIKVPKLNRHQLGGVLSSLSDKGIVHIDQNKDTSYAPDPHPGSIFELFVEDEP